jgi:hypothetical protein
MSKKWYSVLNVVADITVPRLEFSIAAAAVVVVPIDGAKPPPANVPTCGMTDRGRRNPVSCLTPVLGAIGMACVNITVRRDTVRRDQRKILDRMLQMTRWHVLQW